MLEPAGDGGDKPTGRSGEGVEALDAIGGHVEFGSFSGIAWQTRCQTEMAREVLGIRQRVPG